MDLETDCLKQFTRVRFRKRAGRCIRPKLKSSFVCRRMSDRRRSLTSIAIRSFRDSLGWAIQLKKPSEYAVPEKLETVLDGNAALKATFEALTPGRRKSYIFHISTAKQAKTREARAKRCVPMILSGRGFNELPS